MDYLVTVCDKCLTAVCWHGEIMCWESESANTVEKKASELKVLGLEHQDNYSPEKIKKVCGSVNYLEQPK